MGVHGTWVRSDAWVLAAIMVQGRDTCSLTDVVAAADAVNHAILGEDELTAAISRLTGAGLVSSEAGGFRLTASGRAMAAGRRGGMIGQVDHLLRALQRLPVDERPWTPAPGAFDGAVAASQAQARRAVRSSRPAR